MSAGPALIVVGTPIGNLGDISPRAIDALRDADLIACEDTRHTAKLTAAFDIATPRISYHKFNEAQRTSEFRRLFGQGKRIALVCDSGMPGISDPGATIIRAAIEAMREANLIACEDTRHTGKLCAAFEIPTPRVSYHKFNEAQRTKEFRRLFAEGKRIALVCDSGMPGISDPGGTIIQAAIADGVPVEIVPGPSAITTALVLSGLPTARFVFIGFLPAKTTARRKALFELRYEAATLVFYEAGHRIAESVADMLAVLGDRPAALCRELTKLHEEVIRVPLAELAERAEALEHHGEMVVVVSGCTSGEDWADVPLEEHVETLARLLDVPRKEAIRYAASVRGLDRKAVYRALLRE